MHQAMLAQAVLDKVVERASPVSGNRPGTEEVAIG
jgi:hypothetical protein